MNINKSVISKVLLVIVLLSIMLSGCELEENSTFEKGITDNSVQKLGTPINSIEDGIPFALQKVKEWRGDLLLDYVKVYFKDEKEITDSKGVITYFFYGKNVKDGLDADAQVEIDMESNSIISFTSCYATSKILPGGGNGVKIEDWNIDIKDAMEVAVTVIGRDKILSHVKPNIIIRCWEKSWEVAVLSNEELPFDDYLVELNPETGEIIKYRIGTQNVKIER